VAIQSRALHASGTISSGAKQAADQGALPHSNRLRSAPIPPLSPDTLALFLDVDGTLLSIAPHPDAVVVRPELLTLLGRLSERLQGALALISGRSIVDLDKLFEPLVLPCAGVHGLEWRGADAVEHRAGAATLLENLRKPIADFARRREGLLVEDKQQSLALHYRNAPSYETEAEAFLRELIDAESASLELKRGKMVLEVKPSSADKGTAIEAFMEEPPFAGRIPVFIGDDVTDEDGFKTVNRLGGLSIRVGLDENSAAAFSLPNEETVFAWLRSWIADHHEGNVQ